jgi:hypothetical protein
MKKNFTTFLVIVLLTSSLTAQISNYVSGVKIGDAKEKIPIQVSAELISAEAISNMAIAYKQFGVTEYTKLEMIIGGNSATGIIPADAVQPPYLEYYLVINLKDGSLQTYPMNVEQGVTALQISVSGISQKDKEIFVLSPTPGETLVDDEQLISISFVKAPENIDISKTKIFINNQEVSSSALLAGDIIILSGDNLPKNISSGTRSLLIEVYDREGNLYHKISSTYQVVSFEVARALEAKWKYDGYVRGESRNESFNSAGTWYNNIGGEFNTTVSDWKFNAFAYLTSEEKSELQPYNRYSVSIQKGDWLNLKAGDSYPRFPTLVMDGKRVRGFSGNVNLGFFNLQTAFGDITRSVEGKLLKVLSASTLGANIIPINKSKHGFAFGEVELGTFGRKLLAVRPSFGSGENFQLGFSYLHSKDDAGSIEFGARPQENVVVGTDLALSFDEQNIMFTSQAAVSMQNKDISTGTLTDAQIDSVLTNNSNFDVDPATVKDAKKYLEKFITVNQYLGPWNPEELASLGAEAALSLNYLNNNVRASYIYRGNDFQSFGQSYLRTDVKGINIVDRIRMLDNKLFFSIGYEELTDNLQKTKIATTTFRTISASLSIFPRMDFPNITIGYNRFSNSNGLNINDIRNGKYSIDDITNRFLFQLTYDFVAGIRHNSSLSFTTSNRDDSGFGNSDAKFNNLNLSVNSIWDRKLTSTFGIVYSSSEISTIPFDYFSLTAGGRYRMLDDKLTITATISPSFGDFKRQALDVVCDYNVLANLNLAFQMRAYRIPGETTNSIIGLTTRYTL